MHNPKKRNMTICFYSCCTEEYDWFMVVLLGSGSCHIEAANFSWELDYILSTSMDKIFIKHSLHNKI